MIRAPKRRQALLNAAGKAQVKIIRNGKASLLVRHHVVEAHMLCVVLSGSMVEVFDDGCCRAYDVICRYARQALRPLPGK